MSLDWHCFQHDDCFALNEFGRCDALSDVQFKGACPFYKPKKQYEQEEEQRWKRGLQHDNI